MKDTIRSEHNKTHLNTQGCVAENSQLETIQLRLNIENVIKKTNEAVVRGQTGTVRYVPKTS